MRSAVVAAILLGCSPEHATPRSAAEPSLFGDDRVAETLTSMTTLAPVTFSEHEAAFGVGRHCGRADSREIYVIEEPATRFAEFVVPRASLSPRVVIGGCNPTPESLDGVARSFELFTVMPTDPANAGRDPLAKTPVEVMALDRATGMYSFYVFDAAGVQRIIRNVDGSVATILGRRNGALERRTEPGQRCFGCHVHGGPLMAALADPWTSWVSTRTETAVGSYTGETVSIVSETNQLSTTRRAAFANALEGVMRNGIRAFVFGRGRGQGLVARTLSGAEPGGLPLLLRSVFCETELQFASTFDTVPLQLFVDPAAAAGSGLTRPTATPGDSFPHLLPIRSEMDLRIEEALVSAGVLSPSTVRAIRLLDEQNDIFSTARCGVLPKVIAGLPRDSAGVDRHVRAVVRDALPVDATYARALLDGREDGRDAFFAKLRARFDAELTDRKLLEARAAARRADARAMFPGDAHPLPFALVSP